MNTTKKTKRILSILLSLVMVFSMFTGVETTTVYATDTAKINKIDIVIHISDGLANVLADGGTIPTEYYYGSTTSDSTNSIPEWMEVTFYDTDGNTYNKEQMDTIFSGFTICYGIMSKDSYDSCTYITTANPSTDKEYYLGADFCVLKNSNKIFDDSMKDGDYQGVLNVYIGEKKEECKVTKATILQIFNISDGANLTPGQQRTSSWLNDIPLGSATEILKKNEAATPSHTHDWSYSAEGNTITASCVAEKCTLSGNQTVKLEATAEDGSVDTYYSGSSYTGIKKTISTDWTTENGLAEAGDIIYYKADEEGKPTGSALSGAPVDSGKYVATISIKSDTNNYTAQKTFTINKKNVAKPTEDSATFVYTGTEQTYTLGNTTGNSDYKVTNDKRTNAGSQTVTVALKDKTNTQWEDGITGDLTFTFTISTSELKMTAPTGQTKEFNNADQELITAGTNGI